MRYPTRCQIVDVNGGHVGAIPIRTPEESRPHVGKLGTAYKLHDLDGAESVIVELDDGTMLHGSQCWWVPLKTDADAPAPVVEAEATMNDLPPRHGAQPSKPWPMPDESDRRAAELDAIDTDPATPGIQTPYDLEAARRGDRFLAGLYIGLGVGLVVGAIIMMIAVRLP